MCSWGPLLPLGVASTAAGSWRRPRPTGRPLPRRILRRCWERLHARGRHPLRVWCGQTRALREPPEPQGSPPASEAMCVESAEGASGRMRGGPWALRGASIARRGVPSGQRSRPPGRGGSFDRAVRPLHPFSRRVRGPWGSPPRRAEVTALAQGVASCFDRGDLQWGWGGLRWPRRRLPQRSTLSLQGREVPR
jgi:hypothetical protein